MSMHQIIQDNSGISCHAWNGDCTQLAFSPNSNELRIVDAKTWETKFSLKEHDMLIAAMDWHASTNFLVTVGHDRNAFVWTYDSAADEWKPLLVILRIERAALDVKWSPDGTKFAVASSAKCVPICYFEGENNWWVSKMIKKHKSTVLCVAWHPNSQLIATGSSDFKARVFSAYIANVDPAVPNTAEFPAEAGFGETYCEFTCAGWIHTIAYSPSGSILAFAGHDSSISFVNFSQGGSTYVQTIKFAFLPLQQVLFTGDDKLIGGGHDMNPAVFETQAGQWEFTEFLDKFTEDKVEKKTADDSFKGRMNAWQTKDKTGKTNIVADEKTSWLKHQAPITNMKHYVGGKISTTAVDGRIVVW